VTSWLGTGKRLTFNYSVDGEGEAVDGRQTGEVKWGRGWGRGDGGDEMGEVESERGWGKKDGGGEMGEVNCWRGFEYNFLC
jgi:hypothetical protein